MIKKKKEKENNHENKNEININFIKKKKINLIDLSSKICIKISKIVSYIIKFGILLTTEQKIDNYIILFIIKILLKYKKIKKNKKKKKKISKNKLNNKIYSPIVTITGHVDHGKTSLIDYLKSNKTTSKEYSGITQNIGTYQIKTKNGKITFLDTPGHSAFSSMRERGIKMTNIMVLIIAADDGVMPQTIESIKYAKLNNIPIIVAINKIDKIKLKIDRIINELTKYHIVSEEWGGDNIFVNISTKYGVGIDDLLNLILLQAEMLEINTFHNIKAHGIIIESHKNISKIPITSILINQGTLHVGDIILCNSIIGKVSSIKNFSNKTLLKALPGTPVNIIGFNKNPISGNNIIVINKNKILKKTNHKKNINKKLNISYDYNFEEENKNIICINIILKTDKKGSIDDILNEINNIIDNNVKINIIKKKTGNITEKDIILASRYKSIILGFNVEIEKSSYEIKKIKKIKHVYCYHTIHHLISDVKKIIKKDVSILNKKRFMISGIAEIRNIFKSTKFGTIAGCMVLNGIIKRNNYINIVRNNLIIFQGYLESLYRFKRNIKQVSIGMECGITIKSYRNFKIGDKIKSFNS
ncbi:translation initiation factor IF-2 [Candidatus Annandia pinicola]|uniref:translation initiation factor IF-2 n=1 Tax=Candidatus Annandia pinicola TaxID=1345117 RepID=UPI001D022550|nr:translation initiation factor IF-2 [Candidatus Annandia pinicola]